MLCAVLSCLVMSNSLQSHGLYPPPGSSVHGILKARRLEWVAMPSSRDLPDPGVELRSPALQADSLLTEPPGEIYIYIELNKYTVKVN